MGEPWPFLALYFPSAPILLALSNYVTEDVFPAFLVSIILKNLARFRTLDLHWPGLRVEALPFWKALLEELSIDSKSSTSSGILNRCHGLQASRALRRLHIGWKANPWMIQPPTQIWISLPSSIPWPNLTHLSLKECLPWASWYKIFETCTELQECILSVPLEPCPTGSIEVFSLRSLDLRFTVSNANFSFLESLKMAFLRTLKYHCIAQFLDTNTLTDIFRDLGELTTLVIYSLNADWDALFHTLTVASGLPTLPHLQSLAMYSWLRENTTSQSTFTKKSFLKMVSSRADAHFHQSACDIELHILPCKMLNPGDRLATKKSIERALCRRSGGSYSMPRLRVFDTTDAGIILARPSWTAAFPGVDIL